MHNRHYKDILQRVALDTGVDSETADIFCKCFLYELCDELSIRSAVELPYVGDLSARNKTLTPSSVLKALMKKGGSNAIKFNKTNADTSKRSS
jgi:hypothetical protein